MLHIKGFFTPPNKLFNPREGKDGHIKNSRFALIQARQSMIFNGCALLIAHLGIAGVSKALKGKAVSEVIPRVFEPLKFDYSFSVAKINAFSHAAIYTIALDGRSWKSSRDYRLFLRGFVPNRFFSALFMTVFSPFVSKIICSNFAQSTVSLKVSYMASTVSAYVIYYMDRHVPKKGDN